MSKQKEVKQMAEEELYDEKLGEQVLEATRKAVGQKQPLLLHGDPGCGKSLGVHYYAFKNNIDIISYNASDTLRKQETIDEVKSKLRHQRRKTTIIFLDELEVPSAHSKKQYMMKELAKLVLFNKKSAMQTRNVLIAVTNNEYELRRITVRLKAKGSVSKMGKSIKDKTTNVVDCFSFVEKIYYPWKSSIKRYLKKLDVPVPEKLVRDLRTVNQHIMNPVDKMENDLNLESSFDIFENYMNGDFKERGLNTPQPQEIAGSIHNWLISNGMDEKMNSFVKKNQIEFYQMMRIISLAEFYRNDKLYAFLPKNWELVPFYNYRHPTQILKSVGEEK